MSGTPLDHGSSDREFTDTENLKIAAVRTHFLLRQTRGRCLRSGSRDCGAPYQILAARSQELGSSELARFVEEYNNVRSALAASLYPGREHVPPEIRA